MTICTAMTSNAVIFDSSALMAWLNVTDADHTKALAVIGSMRKHYFYLLPLEVLAETLNVVGRKVSHESVVKAGRAILIKKARGEIDFINSDASILSLALDLQASASGGSSFVDCLVMAHAEHQQTPYIFGFDTTFKKNGYRLPGN